MSYRIPREDNPRCGMDLSRELPLFDRTLGGGGSGTSSGCELAGCGTSSAHTECKPDSKLFNNPEVSSVSEPDKSATKLLLRLTRRLSGRRPLGVTRHSEGLRSANTSLSLLEDLRDALGDCGALGGLSLHRA